MVNVSLESAIVRQVRATGRVQHVCISAWWPAHVYIWGLRSAASTCIYVRGLRAVASMYTYMGPDGSGQHVYVAGVQHIYIYIYLMSRACMYLGREGSGQYVHICGVQHVYPSGPLGPGV